MSLNLKKLFKQNSEKNLGFVTEATNTDFDPSVVIEKMTGYKTGASEEDRAKYRQQQLANYLNTIDRLNKNFKIRGARVSAGLGTRTSSPTGTVRRVGANVPASAIQLNDILSKYQNRFLKLAQAKYYQRTTKA
tara:strand:- start:24 stop:425 length:402 start_codon:yes stop_codon:yes gene_type:complete